MKFAKWLFFTGRVYANEDSHRYDTEEDVVVWYNTVGPKDNAQETYSFQTLNLCVGAKKVSQYHDSLGEQLLGHEYVHSGVDLQFRVDQPSKYQCSVTLSSEDVMELQYYILRQYWVQTIIDSLPLWSYIGYANQTDQATRYWIYSHKHYNITYNEDRIVQVQQFNTEVVELKESNIAGKDTVLDFSYSVTWIPTKESFYTRFQHYLDTGFFEHKIHYFSIINSFLIVFFLSGLIVFILMRTVKQDFQRYEFQDRMVDFERELNDDYGWKLVHGDVFRRPTRLSVLSACVGTGMQFLVLSILVMLLTMTGSLYEEPSTILSTMIFIYCISSLLNGYFAGRQFAIYSGRNWIQTVILTAVFWPGVVAMVGMIINTIAIMYTSSKAVSFSSMISILAMWIMFVIPLTLFSFMLGRRSQLQGATFPVRVNPIPRQIPYRPWYLSNVVFMIGSGLIPFGCIAVELYFILDSIWTYKIYYVYGFLLTIFLILVFVTASVAIVITCTTYSCRYYAQF
jgi:transmembrane 9 superfamily member 3